MDREYLNETLPRLTGDLTSFIQVPVSVKGLRKHLGKL